MRVIKEFLDLLSIKYNRSTIDHFLAVHPDHPSILSFSELLDEYKIPNAGIRIDKENFPSIPVPFICKTASNEGDFCLVKALSSNEITYFNEQNEWRTRPLKDFFMQYQGAVLVAEPDGNSAEPDYKKTRLHELVRAAAAVVLVSLLIFAAGRSLYDNLQQNGSLRFLLVTYFILQLAGAGISTLLVIQSLNLNNHFVNNLCSSASGNGCKNILSSEAANVPFLGVSWSVTGIVYFVTNIIALSFADKEMVSWIAALSVLAMVYPGYSIYYQYRIAKAWCRLCLCIQFVLLSSGLVMALRAGAGSWLSLPSIYAPVFYALIGCAVALVWYLLKPLLLLKIKVDKLTGDVNVFKKNEHIFWSLLGDQRSVEPIGKAAEIVLGNPAAPFEITFVSNPFCKPCKNMHAALNQFLATERERLRLKIVFTASYKVNDINNHVIRKLIEIYMHDGAGAFEAAFADWYANGIPDPQKWIDAHSHTLSRLHEANSVMLMHRDWCGEFDITHTPAVFYNNHLYLSQYSLADLKWFLAMPN